MKRTLLLMAALLLPVLLFCGCESDKGGAAHTNPPRVTANVTSSPAPASPTPTVKPTETPTEAPTEKPTEAPATGAPATDGGVPATDAPVPSESPQARRGILPGGGMA